jgi:hypothetical protein
MSRIRRNRARFTLIIIVVFLSACPKDSALAYTYLMLAKAETARPFPKEGQAILDQLKSDLSPAQLEAAEDTIADWKPRPTALTMKARSGVEAAKRLVASSRN